MDVQQAPSLSALAAMAERAAVRRATHPFQMATSFGHLTDGTHLFTRHPDQPLSLCRNLTRPTRHAALKPVVLTGVTCAMCLREFAHRVAPQ